MPDQKLSNKFIRGIFSTGIGTLATIVLSMVSIMIAVRYVSKEELGIYFLIVTILTAIDLIADCGVNISTIKNIACAETDEKKVIAGSVFIYKLLIAVVSSLMILIVHNLALLLGFNHEFQQYVYLIMLLLIGESVNTVLNSMLQGYQQFRAMAFAKIVLSVTNCLAIIVLIRIYQLGVNGLIYTRFLALLLVILYQVKILVPYMMFRLNKLAVMQVLKFGFPLGLNNILSFIFLRLDTLVIGAFLTPASVALYSVATKIPDASRQMFEAFRSVFFPNMSELFSQNKKSDAETILNNSLRISSFITVLIALIVFLFQKPIIVLLFSSNYVDSAPVLSILMMVLSIGLIGNIMGTSLVAAGFSKLPVMINIVDTVTTVVTNLLFIPKFGVMGAAYAALVSRIITNPVNVYFLRKNKIDIRIHHYLKPIAIYLLCVGCNLVLKNDTIYFKLILLSLYISLCSLAKVISYSDICHVCNGLGNRPAKGTV